ncbi:GTP cyclohydrolase [Pelosinus sp. sgz500959]|uniref:GTP cyclohydrolase n=1 Tax=Pelosinus sp. sgz500959 TaxID=3242472 RepID=UPI00366CD948
MRKINIAVVGPADSVALIKEVGKEYAQQVEFTTLTYTKPTEVPHLMEKMPISPDAWLFSGQVPYYYALDKQLTTKPLFYIPHTGSSLYRVLLQISCIEKLDFDSISFDLLSRSEIEDTFADIPLQVKNIYVKEFDNIISAEDLVTYHYKLWKDGKTKAAVTTLQSAYAELKKKNMPVFRIWPLRDNIRTTLNLAIQTVKAAAFKESQIAVQYIAIDDYSTVVREARSSYEVRRLEATLYTILINYTEMVKGSINVHGHGQYSIYSTRGAIEKITDYFTVMPIKEDLIKALSVPVSGGIGFGMTAHAAEENAYKAMGFARHNGKGNWMVVSDDGTVSGPLSSPSYLQYSLRMDDVECQQLANQLGVSGTTINRLLASLNKMDIEAVDAEELATHLSMTTRSARRLLSALVDHNLAVVSRQEALHKGRPRNLYRLLLDSLSK